MIGNTAGVDNAETPVGFDVSLVEPWMAANTRVVPPCRWTRLTGGHSNLTYLLTDSTGEEFVIRRPPQGELLPKAHDMFREYRIIEALHPVGIPVAEPIGYCDDRTVCDKHFYVMGKVGGQALYTGTDAAEWLDLDARARVGRSFMETLAAIHSIEPADVGLGDLGRPDGYVARQIRTWYGSWTASAEFADYDDDRIHELHSWLNDRLPEQGPGRVVHGDYGVHNSMVGSDGSLVAVLDWEIATLGDPLADFAYALNAWSQADEAAAVEADAATAIEGFCSRDDLVEYYAALTGADLSDLSYYRAFNSFKTACILHGVYARYRMGQKSTDGVDMDGLFSRIATSIELAVAHAADT